MSLPPGPTATESEQAFAWFARPYDFLRDCRAKYGNTFTLRMPRWGTIVVFSDPEAVREVFSASPTALPAGKANARHQPFFGPGSLLNLDGERHTQQRRLLLPALHAKRMRHYGSLMRAICRATTSQWPDEHTVVVQEVMLAISVEIIMRAIFGIEAGAADYARVKELVSIVVEMIYSAAPTAEGATSELRQLSDELDALLLAEVARRRASTEAPGEDILSQLLDAVATGVAPATDTELRDELVTLLLAGHETTATVLTWAMHWIHASGVRARLDSELGAMTDEDFVDAAKLPYLHAVCLEALRIHPVIPIAYRYVEQSTRIAGVSLEPGMYVALATYLLHHRPDIYPDADVFRPERFLERAYSPNEFIPFGGGIRRCVGMSFAVYEMKAVLSALLDDFDFRPANVRPVRPVRRSITIAPTEGNRMVAIRRNRNKGA